MTLSAALALAVLAASFAGALHGLGDSLAVFRLLIAGAALALLLAARPRRWLFWPGMGLCLAAAGSVLLHKLPDEPAGPLRVYQKNMFHRNGDIAGLAADILASDADIVTLQEVSVGNEALLARLAEAYPVQHLCRFSSRSGIAVLTRLEAGDPICEAFVGLAGLRVETGQGPVWALSLHLSWPYPHSQPAQLDRLAPRLARLDAPVILGGDFNMVPWSHALARVARAGGLRRAEPSRATFRLGPLPLPIDHVFAPGGGRAEARPALGSDHRGILAFVHARPSK